MMKILYFLPDTHLGVLGFAMHSDGTGQGDLNLSFSKDESQSPPTINGVEPYKGKYNNIAMNGKEVYKFATRKVSLKGLSYLWCKTRRRTR